MSKQDHESRFTCWFPGVPSLLSCFYNSNTSTSVLSPQAGSCLKPRVVLSQPNHAHYGQHVSRGIPALTHILGPLGTYRPVTLLIYEYNYYSKWATPKHPFDFQKVIEAGSHPPAMSTARDADGILLGDFNQDGEVDESENTGFAFVEHWGVGNTGTQQSGPFCHAWFDDNYVARVAMRVYGGPEPWGLYESSVKSRFVVLEGDKTHDPYPNAMEDEAQYPDQISLHALHLANNGKWNKVVESVHALLKKSAARYNIVTKRFDYPAIRDFYHLCDMKLVVQRVLDSGFKKLSEKERVWMFQHAVALESWIMSLHIRNAESGVFSSWKTGMKVGDGSLINTETTTLAMLALGSGAQWKFEPTEEPMCPGAGFVQFPGT
ncbi:hypothetical protein HDU98_004213 [Podochytrium sp. JEL0797]|nr:hypothetical protein HDU98_004213 [Podochytrium sp. JEL0797]